MTTMTDSELKSILAAEIADSLAHLGGELSEQRRKALRYYLGEPFGNEQEGRSKVVSTDVADVVEWILPALLKIFTAGDEVVRFEPTGPEDEEVAKQATEYVNWIFARDNAGFFALEGAQGLRAIGHHRVDRFFWNDVNQSYLNRITAAVDPISKLYVVSYPGAGSDLTGGTPNRLLIYNWTADRWSRAEVDVEMICQAASQSGRTLDDLDSYLPNLDALPFSLDNRFWTGSGRLLLAGFTQAHMIAFFNGPNLAATVDTGEAQVAPGRRALVRSLRPIVEGDAGGATVSVRAGTRNRTIDPVAFDAPAAMNAFGHCAVRSNGRYLRARIEVAAGAAWRHIQGIDEVETSTAGAR
jgi:hypothetical protein